MKKIILIVGCVVSSLFAQAQKIKEADVPQSVKGRFSALFTEAKNIKWENESGNFSAAFNQNGNEMAALFAPNGQCLQTEKEIKLNELPLSVMQYVEKRLNNKKIKTASKITDAKSTSSYKIEVGNEYFLFDTSGKYLRTLKAN